MGRGVLLWLLGVPIPIIILRGCSSAADPAKPQPGLRLHRSTVQWNAPTTMIAMTSANARAIHLKSFRSFRVIFLAARP
jgi:hypothetical protein